jgi:hypothetical protein
MWKSKYELWKRGLYLDEMSETRKDQQNTVEWGCITLIGFASGVLFGAFAWELKGGF